jgi:hypothetical protein
MGKVEKEGKKGTRKTKGGEVNRKTGRQSHMGYHPHPNTQEMYLLCKGTHPHHHPGDQSTHHNKTRIHKMALIQVHPNANVVSVPKRAKI